VKTGIQGICNYLKILDSRSLLNACWDKLHGPVPMYRGMTINYFSGFITSLSKNNKKEISV